MKEIRENKFKKKVKHGKEGLGIRGGIAESIKVGQESVSCRPTLPVFG